MLMKTLAASATISLLLVVGAEPASANRLADLLHKQIPVGNKICFATHPHFSDSGAFPIRAEAEARAITAWERFTALEYTRTWASYALAWQKTMKCTEGKNHRGPLWSCSIRAIPCRAR
jgi:hypothetical protein